MRATVELRQRLGLGDAFEGYELEAERLDRQGWNSKHPFIEPVLKLVEPKLIIELGVWKGMSAIHMADICAINGYDAPILAVDTWLGSSAHLSDKRGGELSKVNGYPTLYRTFLANVHDAGHQDRIIPVPMDGNSAAVALGRFGLKADVIHIDASHEYAACLTDYRNYWPLLADDGVLICDDYGNWPEVTRATCEFAAEVDRPLFASMKKALIPKDPNLGFEMVLKKRAKISR